MSWLKDSKQRSQAEPAQAKKVVNA
jgi:hypothetical protein